MSTASTVGANGYWCKREHGQGDLLSQANPNRQAVRVQAPSNESLSNESDTALKSDRSSTTPGNYGSGWFLINKRSRWCMLLGGKLCCDGHSVDLRRDLLYVHAWTATGQGTASPDAHDALITGPTG